MGRLRRRVLPGVPPEKTGRHAGTAQIAHRTRLRERRARDDPRRKRRGAPDRSRPHLLPSSCFRLAERFQADATDYFVRLWEILDRREQTPEAVINLARRDGREIYSSILQRSFAIRQESQRVIVERLIGMFEKIDGSVVPELIERCYFENRQQNARAMADLLMPIRLRAIPVLESIMDPTHRSFQPHRLLAALRLYFIMRADQAGPVAKRLHESENAAVRKALLIELARARLPEISRPIFRDTLGARSKDVTPEERALAAYGLGEIGDRESVEPLRRLTKGPLLFGRSEPLPLRLASLYAYARITKDTKPETLGALYRRAKGMGIYRLFK
ncbi:MAG: HEAT repeat domain-containing protein [Deltaproteobacteria bacterium]|nr:HEAT repeat domain-containing protein [Deltaproteobacteria bacterium]